MRDYDEAREQLFFGLFKEYFDSEKDAGKQHDPANYSLERMYPLAELAGNPERRLKVIHIAGTKGKGSTSHFISALLEASGKMAGLFTSPHLCTVRERFQVNNLLLPYDVLIRESTEFLKDVKANGLKPSLFELFTVLALKMFASQGVEYAVMETGIGGRLDATNYIPNPVMTVIAPVSFDHVALLGNTIEAIASEKAGIIKSGVPVVISKQPYAAAEKVLLDKAVSVSAPVLRPSDLAETVLFLPERFPFFLRENFCSSLKAVEALGLRPQPKNFKLPQLRARMELIRQHPRMVLLDAAHNGDSMQKLVAGLAEMYPDVNWTVVLGCVKGKDVHGMAQALKALPNATFILTNPQTGKGSALPELETEAKNAGLPILCTIPELKTTSQLPQDVPLLFTGSFFTALIGEELFGGRE
ncbi:MAG: hypothetical protein IKP00_02835 [Victivallales bacterium]|nr:hypothetical protein [Victivallales bacterium]